MYDPTSQKPDSWDPRTDLMRPFSWLKPRAVTVEADLFGGACSEAEIDAAFAVMSCLGNARHTFALETANLARWNAYRDDSETRFRVARATLELPSWTEQQEARSSEPRLFAPEEAPLSPEIIEGKRRTAARLVWPPKTAKAAWPPQNVRVVAAERGETEEP